MEILSEYETKRNQLHAGLRGLLAGTNRDDIHPEFFELQNNLEASTYEVYGVDGGPISQLVRYDTLGIVIISYEIRKDGWYTWTGSEFSLREFPSSKGRLLTTKIQKLMEELEFQVPDRIDPKDFLRL